MWKIVATAYIATVAAAAQAADQPLHFMFSRLPAHGISATRAVPQAPSLPTWIFKWAYNDQGFSARFVGKGPGSGLSTTTPVYLIPIKLTLGTNVRDPTVADPSGTSPLNHTRTSPVFDSSTDYVQAGTDLGKTQYIDAFQRASLWGTVKSHTSYHVLLGTPTVEPEQSVTIPSNEGSTISAFGQTVVVASQSWFDSTVTPMLASLKIPADSLPIFVITGTYLSQSSDSSGCCIGGYHSVYNGQTYAEFGYITNVQAGTQAFAEDVSALSHEVGEWATDPLLNNTSIPSSCAVVGNSLYEVGDPLEGNANYGNYPYTVGSFVYHLQDLVLPTYFGAKAGGSAPKLNQTFQGTALNVCQNGG